MTVLLPGSTFGIANSQSFSSSPGFLLDNLERQGLNAGMVRISVKKPARVLGRICLDTVNGGSGRLYTADL